MSAAQRERQLLIGRDASDLAFRMGQAVQGSLMNRAMHHAAARNADTVSAADVEAAAVELGRAGAFEPAGDTANGEESRVRFDAAGSGRQHNP